MSEVFTYPIKFLRQLFSMVLTDRQRFVEMRGLLKSEYFENAHHQYVWSKLSDFFETHKELPTRDVLVYEIETDSKRRGPSQPIIEEIAEIFNSPVENAQWLRERTVQFIKEYVIRQSIQQTLSLADSHNFDAIPDVWRELLKISTNNKRMLLFEEASVWIRTEDKSRRLSTGFKRLDDALRGGWSPAELNLFLARTSVGKSIMLMRSAVQALMEGKSVYFASNEMSREKIARRFLTALLSKTPTSKPWTEMTAQELDFYLKSMKHMLAGADVVIERYPAGALTSAQLHGDILQQQQVVQHRFDVVCVDYLDEMSPNRGHTGKDEYQNRRFICQDLINMSEELDCYLVSATQAQRGAGVSHGQDGKAEQTMVDSENVGDSYWVSRLAHVMISLNQTASQRATGRLDLFVAKARDGDKGQIIPCLMDYSTMSVIEQTQAPKVQQGLAKQLLSSNVPGIIKQSIR